MAKPTKIVVHFDDGTTTDIPAQGVGSIFMNEVKAKKCGHNPPYGKPPHAAAGSSATSGSAGGTTVSAMDTGESCYMINGVIVCP
jgi:hypothetical protein